MLLPQRNGTNYKSLSDAQTLLENKYSLLLKCHEAGSQNSKVTISLSKICIYKSSYVLAL